MTHTYQITGMTCGGCEAKVKSLLSGLPSMQHVELDREAKKATLTMSTHISTATLQQALGGHKSRYRIEMDDVMHSQEKTSWLVTYKPILTIFFYILGVSLLVQVGNLGFDWTSWMNHFMAGFFLVFSFFKMLNLSGFAASYRMYDVVAKAIPAWGYAYAFIELLLGIAYLIGFDPLLTNIVTFVVMSASIVGVLQSVMNKRKIRCACLGAVFNLPMSTVTIIEDALMIAMSLAMIIHLV